MGDGCRESGLQRMCYCASGPYLLRAYAVCCCCCCLLLLMQLLLVLKSAIRRHARYCCAAAAALQQYTTCTALHASAADAIAAHACRQHSLLFRWLRHQRVQVLGPCTLLRCSAAGPNAACCHW
jgi:hypothetical protein